MIFNVCSKKLGKLIIELNRSSPSLSESLLPLDPLISALEKISAIVNSLILEFSPLLTVFSSLNTSTILSKPAAPLNMMSVPLDRHQIFFYGY